MPTKIMNKSYVEITVGMRVELDIQLKTDTNGMENMLSLSSVVEEISDDGSLLIQMPIHQGNHYPLPRDNAFTMLIFAGSEMYALPVMFVERIEQSGFMYAKIRRFGKITPHQRRDCYRLPCSLPVTVERLCLTESEIQQESQPSEGQMIDFSDGGMLFTTNEIIEKNEKLALTFDIGQPETIEGMALRAERIEEGKYLFRVVVQFMSKDKAQRQRFYKYIVDKQLEERRRWA